MSPARTGTEYGPQAIHDLYDELVRLAPQLGAELGGIVGDSSHTSGYHRARAILPPDDYSVTLWRDKRGDGWAASALDITPRAPGAVPLLTHRLARAVETGDARMRPVREFYGTLDGANVYGWDLRYKQPRTSDRSHLWHVHLSFFRVHSNNAAALLPVAQLLAGK